LLDMGIAGSQISLSSQQSAHDLPVLLQAGVQYIATSMRQLTRYAEVSGPGTSVGRRVNPSLGGAGHNNRTSTGGVASSFGLWHEYVESALEFADSKQVTINRLHMHVGYGADPAIWGNVIDTALSVVRRMPDVTVL